MTNNRADRKIDAVSSPKRIKLQQAFGEAAYDQWSCIIFLLALTYGWCVSYPVAYLVGSFIASYYLYSMPPLRLKRVFFFSKSFIAFNSVASALAGFSVRRHSARFSLARCDYCHGHTYQRHPVHRP